MTIHLLYFHPGKKKSMERCCICRSLLKQNERRPKGYNWCTIQRQNRKIQIREAFPEPSFLWGGNPIGIRFLLSRVPERAI